MPALLILDGLEVVCPAAASGGDPGLVEPGGDALVAWLCDVLAALRSPSRPPLPGAADGHVAPKFALYFPQQFAAHGLAAGGARCGCFAAQTVATGSDLPLHHGAHAPDLQSHQQP